MSVGIISNVQYASRNILITAGKVDFKEYLPNSLYSPHMEEYSFSKYSVMSGGFLGFQNIRVLA